MIYTREIAVEFNHCDPAGIVFYPRYFEMLNSVIENFFADVLKLPFQRMLAEGHGVPAARIEADFRKPSRLGERLHFSLEVVKIGETSLVLGVSAASASDAAELRMRTTIVLVWLGKGGVPGPWLPELRTTLLAFKAEGAAG